MAIINDDDMTYFGVLMNRYNIDDGIYLFKPEYLIEGTIQKENDEVYFTDEMDNDFLTIHDAESLTTDEHLAVGYIISEDELTKKYPDLSIPEAKIEYFDSIREMTHIGFLLARKDRIVVVPLDLSTMFDVINDSKNSEISNVVKLPNSNAQFLNSKDYELENFDNLDTKEMMVISPEIFKDLFNCKNYDDLIGKLKKIKENYEQISTPVMEPEKDNSKIISKLAFFKQDITGNHIIDLFNASCETLLFIADLKAIRDSIKEINSIFSDLAMTMDSSSKKYPKLVEVAQDNLYALIDCLDDISKLDNISVIKSSIRKIQRNNISNIRAVGAAYDEMRKPTSLATIDPSTHDQKQIELEEAFSDKQSSKQTFDYLKVYNQMVERIIGRDAQIGSILTAIDKMDKLVDSNKKYSILIAGTTGTGKTQTFNELKKAMPDRPIIIVDTNQLTQEGYVGGKIERNILGALLSEAHLINTRTKKEKNGISDEDVALAERGIVILDEIDKRAEKGTKDNVNCGAVIDQFLKLMEGTNYMAEVGKENIPFNTSKLGIMASGAFQEYFEEKEKGTHIAGFRTSNDAETDEFKKYSEVKPEDLVKYGLNSQFVGRFQMVVLYPPHTVSSLIELEMNEETSNINNERKYFSEKGIELVCDEEFVQEAAKEAIKLKTGGRGLSNIIARCLSNVGDEINRNPGVYKIIFLPQEAVHQPGQVMLIKNDGGHILMQDALIKKADEAQERRALKKITFNQEALNCALQHKSKICKSESHDMIIVPQTAKEKQLGKK